MKIRLPNLGAEWAVLGFCAWQASDMLNAWRHSPFDRWGWLACAIWLTPTLASALGLLAPRPPTTRAAQLAWCALALWLAGVLTDMHCLKHGALALACAAITLPLRFGILWLGLSLAWLPALGWLLGGLSVFGVAAIRLSLAALAALLGLAEMQPAFRRVSE